MTLLISLRTLIGLAVVVSSIFLATPSVTATSIHDIQGASHISPLNGQGVSNVPGIVTFKVTNGFYFQEPNDDANDATSEGMFVFTSSAPTVNLGDSVLVSGTVSEFRPNSLTTNLTITEITGPTVIVQSTGNPLPAPVVIGVGGRIPPNQVIENDATGDIESSGVFDPALDGIDFYESIEGMLVQVNNAIVVQPTARFSVAPGALAEIGIIGDNGTQAGLRSARGGLIAQATDFNPERIILADTNTNTPDVKVGDQFMGAFVGVMDYSFGNYKLRLTSAFPSLNAPALPKGSTTLAASSLRLTLATLNLNNLTLSDAQSKFDGFASLIVTNLASPSIICADAVLDDSGLTNDGVVTSDATLNNLVAAISAAGGPAYSFRYINPANNQDGAVGNSRQVFLFRADVVSFVDKAGATATTANSVLVGGTGAELQYSPGRIDPANAAFTNIRKPLAGEFLFRNQRLIVIGNHFVSKNSDTPLFGKSQPPMLVSETQRTQGAQVVENFVQSINAVDVNARVVTAGNFNDFEFSTALTTLDASPLTNLVKGLAANDRYTFNLEGNSEALHHILVSPNLGTNGARAEVAHTSADYVATDRLNDHDPLVAAIIAVPTTFAEWQALYFNATELANTAISGFSADPDIDSKVNGLEAALGTHPRLGLGGQVGPAGIAIVGSGAGARPALTFDRPTIALSDLTLEVQEGTSPDGTSFSTIATKVGTSGWTGTATVTETPIAGADKVHVEVQSLHTLSFGKTFLRLKVTK